jgi:nucleoside-diphosphate-sugar epimerase
LKILISGASGFIGKYVVLQLLDKGIEIVVLVRSKKRFLERMGNSHNLIGITISEYEITKDNKLLDSFQNIDCFIDIAWENVRNVNSKTHSEFNFPAHLNLIKKLSRNIKNIFVLGSCYEYGLCKGAINESYPLNPITNYGRAKKNLYHSLLELSYLNNFNLIWGRLFYIYGKDQNISTFYGELINAIANNKNQFNMSSGKQKLDYLRIDKAAEFIAELACKNKNLGAVNICSGNPISLIDFAKNIVKFHSSNIKLNTGFYPNRNYESNNFWGDNTYLNTILKK